MTLFAVQLYSWTTLGWIRQTLMRLYNLENGKRFGLALLHIHNNTEIDLDEVIRRFARIHPRKEIATGQYPV